MSATKETGIMTRSLARRAAALAVIAVVLLGSVGCATTTGVGYSAPVYGGWGGGPSSISGAGYAGRPVWP